MASFPGQSGLTGCTLRSQAPVILILSNLPWVPAHSH